MKVHCIKLFIVAFAVSIICGCATREVVPLGNNTFMVNRGGWPAMNGFACEHECYKAANAFCEANHLVIVSSQPTMIDGAVFQHSASCKLVFVATNTVTK